MGGLLTACRNFGHRKRILVRPVWVDATLRLKADEETGIASYADRHGCGFLRRRQGDGKCTDGLRERPGDARGEVAGGG